MNSLNFCHYYKQKSADIYVFFSHSFFVSFSHKLEIHPLKMSVNNLIINFLDPRFSSMCKLESDKVSEDDYPVGNLISSDWRRRSLGFMSYRVCTPPLEITIHFDFKITLKGIKVSSKFNYLYSK